MSVIKGRIDQIRFFPGTSSFRVMIGGLDIIVPTIDPAVVDVNGELPPRNRFAEGPYTEVRGWVLDQIASHPGPVEVEIDMDPGDYVQVKRASFRLIPHKKTSTQANTLNTPDPVPGEVP